MRFVERYVVIKRFYSSISSATTTLQTTRQQKIVNQVQLPIISRKRLKKTDFIIGLADVRRHISSNLLPLSNPSKEKGADLKKKKLKDARENGFQETYAETEKITRQFHAELCLPGLVGRSCFRSNAEAGKGVQSHFK